MINADVNVFQKEILIQILPLRPHTDKEVLLNHDY
jgi:hypothetical protein